MASTNFDAVERGIYFVVVVIGVYFTIATVVGHRRHWDVFEEVKFGQVPVAFLQHPEPNCSFLGEPQEKLLHCHLLRHRHHQRGHLLRCHQHHHYHHLLHPRLHLIQLL